MCSPGGLSADLKETQRPLRRAASRTNGTVTCAQDSCVCRETCLDDIWIEQATLTLELQC